MTRIWTGGDGWEGHSLQSRACTLLSLKETSRWCNEEKGKKIEVEATVANTHWKEASCSAPTDSCGDQCFQFLQLLKKRTKPTVWTQENTSAGWKPSAGIAHSAEGLQPLWKHHMQRQGENSYQAPKGPRRMWCAHFLSLIMYLSLIGQLYQPPVTSVFHCQSPLPFLVLTAPSSINVTLSGMLMKGIACYSSFLRTRPFF